MVTYNQVTNVEVKRSRTRPVYNRSRLLDGICVGLCFPAAGIFVLCSAFTLAEGILRSASMLHTLILKSGLRAPMSFFDSTPSGRIVNRFSKDIDVVDSQLPRSLHSWVVCALSVMGTIAVICYSTPMFLVIILPMSILYYLVQVHLVDRFVLSALLWPFFFCGCP